MRMDIRRMESRRMESRRMESRRMESRRMGSRRMESRRAAGLHIGTAVRKARRAGRQILGQVDFTLRIAPGNYRAEAAANDTEVLELKHSDLQRCEAGGGGGG